MDIVLYLLKPGRMIVGEQLMDDDGSVGDLHDGPMPWLALSDILLANRREFVGIALHAHESFAARARSFANACDPKIARYFPNHIAMAIPRYRERLSGTKFSVLELRWSEIEPDEERIEQLNDYWYYRMTDDPDTAFPRAWGIPGIERIMASGDLVFPRRHY